MHRGFLTLGLACGLCACVPNGNEATHAPFSIYGNWYGAYSESGKMNSCDGPPRQNTCKVINYSQKNEQYLRFDPDGSGAGHYIYARNNSGDTSESYQMWDSLVWSMSDDSLYFVQTAMKIGSRDWEHQDTTQAYAKQGFGYVIDGGEIRLKAYLMIDSGGSRVDLALAKK